MKRLIVLLLLVSVPCWSQEMRDVKKRRAFDKKFWLATAVVVGTTFLDVESTARCLRSHTCAEGNPIYGSHPTRAKMYGIKGPFAAFTIFSTWWLKRDDMRKMERYELRNDPRTPEPRIWEKPKQYWYLPSVIFGTVSGGAGIYNLTAGNKKTTLPAQPMRGSENPNSIVGGLSGSVRVSDLNVKPSNTGTRELLRLLGDGTPQ